MTTLLFATVQGGTIFNFIIFLKMARNLDILLGTMIIKLIINKFNWNNNVFVRWILKSSKNIIYISIYKVMIIKLPYLIIVLLIFVGKIIRFFFFKRWIYQVPKLNIIEKVKARFDERFQMAMESIFSFLIPIHYWFQQSKFQLLMPFFHWLSSLKNSGQSSKETLDTLYMRKLQTISFIASVCVGCFQLFVWF